MKILFINQTFHPDIAATAQHLTELAVALVDRGHDVSILTSRRAYNHPGEKFPSLEEWKGIQINRVPTAAFGKNSWWNRFFNFGSFFITAFLRLLRLPRHDLVVALTSPPLIGVLGAVHARRRGSGFVQWVMDLNPDEAIQAGWLPEKGPLTSALKAAARFHFRCAEKIVVLDTFMKDRVAALGADPAKVHVIPPWAHSDNVFFSAKGRESFRKAHGMGERFVVMYSGNHSPCHPLDTLLQIAVALKAESWILFCFVGGGSELDKVKTVQAKERLDNILILPYQEKDQLASSLSAADLHAVVMGDGFTGIVHPCKIYNILAVGAPVLSIGPKKSHVHELIEMLTPTDRAQCVSIRHGDAAAAATRIKTLSQIRPWPRLSSRELAQSFAKEQLTSRMADVMESAIR